MKKGKRRRSHYNIEDGLFSFELSEWKQRRIAPYALLVHVFTVLCLIGYLFSRVDEMIGHESIQFNPSSVATFEFDESKSGLFLLDVAQHFSSRVPLYSELEIEVLDEHYDHLYSVYKDLWQENHPNGEGGIQTYSDTRMSFQVVLPESKKYHVRAFTNYPAELSIQLYHKNSGTLYFLIALWVSGIVSGIFLLGLTKWGTPSMMITKVRRSKPLKHNRGAIRFSIALGTIFLGLILFSVRYTGYAKGGEHTELPSLFFKKNEVKYLG